MAALTEIHPVDGVVRRKGTWEYAPLGISLPAPPLLLAPDSSPEAFARAREALDVGLASARFVGRRRFVDRLIQSGQLPATESAAVPSGTAPSLAVVAAMMFRSLGWPLALVAACWCGAELAGLRVLALLGSLTFLILVSLILHEAGHVLVFRRLAPSAPALFTSRIGRFRLVRGRLPMRQDLAVTIAGPIGPFLMPAVLFPFHVWQPILFWTALVVAGSHLALLLRNDGDGAMLRAALRQGRNEEST